MTLLLLVGTVAAHLQFVRPSKLILSMLRMEEPGSYRLHKSERYRHVCSPPSVLVPTLKDSSAAFCLPSKYQSFSEEAAM